jgi:hypothetical protein
MRCTPVVLSFFSSIGSGYIARTCCVAIGPVPRSAFIVDNSVIFPINGRSSPFQAHHSQHQCSCDALVHWFDEIQGGYDGATLFRRERCKRKLRTLQLLAPQGVLIPTYVLRRKNSHFRRFDRDQSMLEKAAVSLLIRRQAADVFICFL